MVVFSAILRFVQELKAGRSSNALLKMVKNTCYAERANNESGEIPVEELVPGDIVLLSASLYFRYRKTKAICLRLQCKK